MVGGKAGHVDTCLPVFEAMGSRVEHMGPSGSGAAAKLVNQVKTLTPAVFCFMKHAYYDNSYFK